MPNKNEQEIKLLKNEINNLKRKNKNLDTANSNLKRKINTLEHLAYKDTLTLLYNRRGLQKNINNLEKEVTYSIIMCDIDKLKAINDNYGHNAGDETIKIVSKLLQESKRKGDLVVRYGGDEFLILLKNCNKNFAKKKCEQLIKIVHEQKKLPFTLSFGISEYNNIDFNEAIQEADMALYYSKNNGRDCITIYNQNMKDKKNDIY